MNHLDRLRALHAATTPGEWHFDCIFAASDPTRTEYEASCITVGDVTLFRSGTFDDYDTELREVIDNAASIADTHNALPSLLACVDALRALAPDHPALAPLLEEQP